MKIVKASANKLHCFSHLLGLDRAKDFPMVNVRMATDCNGSMTAVLRND